MNVFVLFGSTSDEAVYAPFCDALEKQGHQVIFKVLSAHRRPDELAEALKKEEYDVVVGGAGLSAHLPGVIASKVDKPVFGIPVAAHFGGLDSLFSIFQMPFGVPVMSSMPGKERDIVTFLEGMKNKTKSMRKEVINLVINPTILNYEYVSVELDRTKKYMQEREVQYRICRQPQEGELNICLVQESHEVDPSFSSPCIYVPIIEKSVLRNPARALELFYIMERGGLWVGVNNTRNAVASYLKFRR